MNNESNTNKKARVEAPWQLDPRENYSDWKLEIETAEDGHVETYHVHRFNLVFGERKSGYFVKLISKQRFC
jgi:subtilisin-like proprotein convertase family protein